MFKQKEGVNFVNIPLLSKSTRLLQLQDPCCTCCSPSEVQSLTAINHGKPDTHNTITLITSYCCYCYMSIIIIVFVNVMVIIISVIWLSSLLLFLASIWRLMLWLSSLVLFGYHHYGYFLASIWRLAAERHGLPLRLHVWLMPPLHQRQ